MNKLEIVAASDCHVAVPGLEALVGHDAGVSGAPAASLQPGVDVVGAQVGQRRDLIGTRISIITTSDQ